MELFIGFAIGMTFGCWLWWQTLIQSEEMYREYIKVVKDLMEAKWELRCLLETGREHRKSMPSRN